MYKVLIIDDETLAIRYLSSLIDWEAEGFDRPLTALSVSRAVELFSDTRVDIVITDVRMPETDGVTLARKLREINPDFKCIVLTAYRDFEVVQRSVELGISSFLLKHELDAGILKDALRKALEQLADEYEALVAEGKSTFKGDENYRILFEGIACWANLRFTYKTLQSRGINLTASVYGPAFSFLYSNLDELMAAYSYVPNSNCFERELELRVVDAKKNKVDGAIFHMNRSCKHWSGNLYEMERQFREQTGVPTIVFDGDQSDPRAFSEAQYETRVEALVEIMEENKRKEAQA